MTRCVRDGSATLNAFLVQGSRAARSLVTLRRLPPAPPNTLTRALEMVLRALTDVRRSDLSALQVLCESDDPLLAGVANGVASYVWENANDPDSALEASRRSLAVFESRGSPLIRAHAHSRIAELCVAVDRGDEARHHLSAALSVVEEAGARSTAARLRWGMVIADLQRGAIDEAEHWLEQTVRSGGDEAAGVLVIDIAARAEIQLARGDVEAGLHSWRRAADRLRNTESPASGNDLPGLESWALEVQAATVIAHAQHGRLDLVREITDELPRMVSKMITKFIGNPPASFVDYSICGALLLALATVDIDRGEPTGDARVTRSGVRMIALAERFRFVRGFQPTMSAARARQIAEQADKSAYADAVSSYADLDRDELGAAALTALRERAQLNVRDPS